MKLIIQKTTQLSGTVTIPSSKSQCIRALFIATLAAGESVLHNFLDADDTEVALEICETLGAKIEEIKPACHRRCLKVKSAGIPLGTGRSVPPRRHADSLAARQVRLLSQSVLLLSKTQMPFHSKENILNSGNSGITTRFVMPVLGLRQNPDDSLVLDCGDQMKARPVHSLMNALNDLGMKVESFENPGFLPVHISGRLIGGSTTVDGLTSQYLSALLLSCGCAPESTLLTVKNLHERPYVEMTLKWLEDQDIRFHHSRNGHEDIFEIEGGQHYHPFHKIIPGDFSAASYFLAAGALIPGQIVIQGLDTQDPQGDKLLIDILKQMGADILVKDEAVIIKGGKKLEGIKIDANDIPDLVPTLAVIGTQAEGRTEIMNVPQARIKETDRIHSMTGGLTRMGARIEEKKDGMVVYTSELYCASVQGYSDHRTIMAMAVAGLLAKGETEIDTAEGITKTFPDFSVLMKSIGAKMLLRA